jgi:hypothetical protein
MSQTKSSRPPINLPHCAIVRAPGLLPMQYKPSELAAALGIPDRTLRDWLTTGAPHQRDEHNHIWINGREFAAWVEQCRQLKKNKVKLHADDAFCLHCNRPVHMDNPHIVRQTNTFRLLSAACPICGTSIYRGGRNVES